MNNDERCEAYTSLQFIAVFLLSPMQNIKNKRSPPPFPELTFMIHMFEILNIVHLCAIWNAQYFSTQVQTDFDCALECDPVILTSKGSTWMYCRRDGCWERKFLIRKLLTFCFLGCKIQLVISNPILGYCDTHKVHGSISN